MNMWERSCILQFSKKNRMNEDLFICALPPPVPQSFQQEISLTTAKIEHIFHQGEALIEKNEPLDAAVIEEELEELQRYCQEVFGRVERYYKKLIRLPVRPEIESIAKMQRVYFLMSVQCHIFITQSLFSTNCTS